MLLASFFFSTMNVFVKFIPDIPAEEVVFFRSLISLVLSFTILKSQKNNIWGNNPKLLILRGVFGAIALILYFRTLQAIPLASAVTIQFLAPIFTAIMGIYMVHERVKPLQWLFFLLAFAGVVVIQGFDPRISLHYWLLGVGASLASGLAHNFIRKINTTEHPLVIVFYFPLVTLPVTAVLSFFNWHMPSGMEWIYLILIGIFTQIAQVLMTKAIQSEELNRIASLRYVSIIYALLYGFFVFDETFNILTYLGMMLTLCGVILNIWYKYWIVKKQLKKLESE